MPQSWVLKIDATLTGEQNCETEARVSSTNGRGEESAYIWNGVPRGEHAVNGFSVGRGPDTMHSALDDVVRPFMAMTRSERVVLKK